MKANEFDQLVDDNEVDVIEYLDLSTIKRAGLEVQRINVDFPKWMLNALDKEAARLGIARQAVIKTWIAAKIEQSIISDSPYA